MNLSRTIWIAPLLALAWYGSAASTAKASPDTGLVGYWKLNGDAKDHSGTGNHGRNHGVDLNTGAFDGRGADRPSM